MSAYVVHHINIRRIQNLKQAIQSYATRLWGYLRHKALHLDLEQCYL